MHMIAPVSAGTDSVVWVENSIQTMPARAAGSAVMITNGSDHDWNVETIRRWIRTIAPKSANSNPENALFMVSTWPSNATELPFGTSFAVRWISLLTSAATA